MQTKKKVLIGGLSSLAVAAGVTMTGGTSAYFYDLENSQDNRIAACSLDLQPGAAKIRQTADGSEDGSRADLQFTTLDAGGLYKMSIGNMEPGDAFKVIIPVSNVGTCIGELWGDLRGPFKDYEGTQYEPETQRQLTYDPDVQDADDDERGLIVAQADNGTISGSQIDAYDGGAGDLDNRVLVYYGPDAEGNQLADETFSEFAWRKPAMMDSKFKPGDSTNIVVYLTVPDSGAPGDGNEIMGDSFDFLIDLALAQPNKLNSTNTVNGLHAVPADPNLGGPAAP